MKKQRMTAENAQELMEIVRSIQEGHEPDYERKKREALEQEQARERARQEAEEKARQEALKKEEKARLARERQEEKERRKAERQQWMEEVRKKDRPDADSEMEENVNESALQDPIPKEDKPEEKTDGYSSNLKGSEVEEAETEEQETEEETLRSRITEKIRNVFSEAARQSEVREQQRRAVSYEPDAFERLLDSDGEDPLSHLLEEFFGKLSRKKKMIENHLHPEEESSGQEDSVYAKEEEIDDSEEETVISGKTAYKAEMQSIRPEFSEEEEDDWEEEEDGPVFVRRRIGSLSASEKEIMPEGEKPLSAASQENSEEPAEIPEIPETLSSDSRASRAENLKSWFSRIKAGKKKPLDDQKEEKEEPAVLLTGKPEEETEPETEPDRREESLTDVAAEAAISEDGDPVKENLPWKKGLLIPGIIGALLILAAGICLYLFVFSRSGGRVVQSEDGLKVTILEEPENWCSQAQIRLKVSEKDAVVQINGQECPRQEDGTYVYNAAEATLEIQVLTSTETKNAEILLDYLDAEAPVVELTQEEGSFTLSAADAKSGVAGIYYAKLSEDSYAEIPQYQEYTSPVTKEKNTIYYYYAIDQAGNRSIPVSSSLETATGLQLSQTQLHMAPQDTAYLMVEPVPEKALLSQVAYESTDPSVVTVDQKGSLTAMSEGSAQIRVSAAGLSPISCAVTVSTSRSITISAIGDCTLGTDENFNTSSNFTAYYNSYGETYFFDQVRSVLQEDDITFANLEGTFTDSTARESKTYAFKGDPSYTGILRDGSIEVVTLANNHSSDYGEQSNADTKEALDEAQISWCEGDSIAYQTVEGIKTAFIGIYVLNDGLGREDQVKSTIAEAKSQGADLVVVAFHWGTEKETTPDTTQTTLAHLAVDCGADLVVGHHPHVLQGIELYNGVYIVYSLANFCFGGNSNPTDTDTMIFRQTFTFDANGNKEENTEDIAIIPCSVTSVSGANNYQPVIATGSTAEKILERINEYSEAFGQTYTLSDMDE